MEVERVKTNLTRATTVDEIRTLQGQCKAYETVRKWVTEAPMDTSENATR